ncbi:MAG: hypothetical protein AAGM16_15730 [Pseudomonadota bacterium]
MLAALIIFAIVLGILNVLPETKHLDSNTAIAAVVPPLLLNWLLTLAVSTFQLLPSLAVAGITLYFVVPFLWLRFTLGETMKVAFIVATVTVLTAVVVGVGFEFLLMQA